MVLILHFINIIVLIVFNQYQYYCMICYFVIVCYLKEQINSLNLLNVCQLDTTSQVELYFGINDAICISISNFVRSL